MNPWGIRDMEEIAFVGNGHNRRLRFWVGDWDFVKKP